MDAFLDWMAYLLGSLDIGTKDDRHRVREWIHWRTKVFVEKRQQKKTQR